MNRYNQVGKRQMFGVYNVQEGPTKNRCRILHLTWNYVTWSDATVVDSMTQLFSISFDFSLFLIIFKGEHIDTMM